MDAFAGQLELSRKIQNGVTDERMRQTTETKMQLCLDMLRDPGMAPETENPEFACSLRIVSWLRSEV